MFHSRRAILLSLIMTIAVPLWAEGGGEPIKIPLVTTAIPDDIMYQSPSDVLGAPWGDENVPGQFYLTEKNPSQTFTLGGIEHIVKVETPTRKPDKLLLKIPTQERTIDLPIPFNLGVGKEPIELTLDNGRKYFLRGNGGPDTFIDREARKEVSVTSCWFWPAGVQTGKIGQSSIALFDSNLDGFYTSGEDGIFIGPPLIFLGTPREPQLVQPLSKYISIPPPTGGIFEIQNLTKDGSELTLLPYHGPTASLEVITPQKGLGHIIMTSDAGLNVMLSGKPGESVTVIPGDYTILAARLYSPLRPQGPRTRMMISGVGMPPLKVAAGAKQTLVLSGPKILEFSAMMVDGKVNIKFDPRHWIKGQAGETYLNVSYDLKNPPEVHLNVDGKSTLLGKMEYG